MRHPSVGRILETPDGMDLFVTSCLGKTIYRDLLSHLATPAEVASMPVSERLAKIYQFRAKDHFKDRSEESARVHEASAIRALQQQKPAVPTANIGAMMLDFMKSKLKVGRIYSVPGHLWRMARFETATSSPTLSLTSVVDAIMPKPSDETRLEDCVFYQVVDNRPELKPQVRVGHIAQNRSQVIVGPLNFQAHNGRAVLMFDASPPPVLFALNVWLERSGFTDLLELIRVWTCRPGRRSSRQSPQA